MIHDVTCGFRLVSFRDCSLFIGSTGPVFRGTGQGLFLMLPSTGHKDFLCFYGTGHELFWEKISQIIFYRHSELSSLLIENDFLNPMVR